MALITQLQVQDVRFPTSLQLDGSDAMHTNPDYSCAYVTLETDKESVKGFGLTFTLGQGTEIVVAAINALKPIIVGQEAYDIFKNFAQFWRLLTSHPQLRWVGPDKGVLHLAVAAIVNALWDLWSRLENKPLWKLLVDLPPEDLVSTIDFRYLTDVITPAEAVDMLKGMRSTAQSREDDLRANGYPAYTTQVGWLGYSNEKVVELCKTYLRQGFTCFKIKVGSDLASDKERCRLVRKTIGDSHKLMVDANQVWDVNEAIAWMKELAEFKPMWIEEPTSPDDILGHATIAKALKGIGIGVATGEMCANKVMFKQFLMADALEFCQIDSCRVAGINEILSIYLMAKKFGVKVCPHAGGVGLSEMVRHLQMWDFISLTGDKTGRYIEYVDQQHEHFKDPAIVKNACYELPSVPGYSCEMYSATLEKYSFPEGQVWQELKR